jgi:hypothetical protein
MFALAAFAAGATGARWRAGPVPIGRLVYDATLFALGAAAALAPIALYFGVHGALDDLWETVIVFNQTHAQTGSNLSPEAIALATWDFGRRMGPLGLLAALGIAAWAVRGADLTPRRPLSRAPALGGKGVPWARSVAEPGQGKSGMEYPGASEAGTPFPWREGGRGVRSPALAVLWLIMCLAGVWIQGKFFSYHWSVAAPALALVAAMGLAWLWADWRAASGVVYRGARLAVYGLVGMVYVVGLWQDQTNGKLARDLPFLVGRSDAPAYLAQFGHSLRGTDVYSFIEAQETAAYLAANTGPEDTVLVWGFQALVNFLADRRAPTTYVFDYPLTVQQEESGYRDRARARLLADLAARPPRYFVIVRNDVNPLQTVDSETLLGEFPELKALVDRDYAPETEIGNFQVLRRKD